MTRLSQQTRMRHDLRPIASMQMRMAIDLLQANKQQLRHKLEMAVRENPLIEIQTDVLSEGCGEKTHSQEVLEELDFEKDHFDWIDDLNEDFHYHFDETYSPIELLSEKSWKEPSPDILQIQPHQPHAQEFLENKLLEICDEPTLRKEALWLASFTDTQGLLEKSLKEISQENQKNLETLKKAQILLQQIEPFGFASESLQEALLIQLDSKNLEGTLCFRLIKNHWKELISKKWQDLAKKEGLKLADIEKALHDHIPGLQLNFYPEIPIQSENTTTIDLLIEFENDKPHVKLLDNPENWLHLQTNYLEGSALQHDSETTSYIKKKKAEFTWLLKALAQRERNLVLVTSAIADWQKEYLTSKGPLKPMVLKDIAQICQIHESTVARACQDKLALSPIGILSMKSLFCSSVKQSEEGELSSSAICEKIKGWIEQEDSKNPLSDEDIVLKLKEEDISCARRTVAKYRMRLGFTSSYQRKRH